MSRAYRIRVSESLSQIVFGSDCVSTHLEILQILPEDAMSELLADELERRGFTREGADLVRTEAGITVRIDPQTATVTVQAEVAEEVELSGERDALVDEDWQAAQRAKIEESVRQRLQDDLAREVEKRQAGARKSATDALEGALSDIRRELDQAVNRVTAEALKRRAAQLGEIKELTEDPQSGSLTIVVEV